MKWYQTEVEREIENEVISRLRKAAAIVRDKAKSLVRVGTVSHYEKRYPVYGEVLPPGTLKKSITFRVSRRLLAAKIGTDYLHGIFQELGTVSKTKRKWAFTPFLRPAAHQTESQVKEILGVTGGIANTGAMKYKPNDILMENFGND